ncbi:MAG: FAD-dependent oxidoreductase, partial [Candidatus Korarchaeum sp.]
MKPVAVIGGGIAGIQAALDLANQGIKVYLIEETPSIGGRMAQLDKTFPTLDCSMCILTPRMVEVARNKNIELLTYHKLLDIKGEAGNFKLKVRKKPRYVDIDKCTGCMVCFKYCPSKVPDEYNLYMSERKAIYIPFPQSVPLKATIDADHCLFFQKGICKNCEKFCPAKAIDYNQKPEDIELDVAAVIFATGYDLIMDADFLREQYGYGVYANVY